MHNKLIEDFAELSGLINIGPLEYISFCAAIIEDGEDNVIEIFNIFEDIIVSINDERIGIYTLANVRGCKHWVLR